jgi:hypothetical protein
MLCAILPHPWAVAPPYPGFGGSTRGGAGQPVACHFAEVMRPLKIAHDTPAAAR